jgi:hypothetical protein
MKGGRPGLRKLALTAHIVSSVGWLGAVAVFLALGVAGLVSEDAETVRAAYVAMESTGWFVLVPLSVASLATGLIESLTTKWGLLRHYWVAMKLAINLLATVVLLLYMRSLGDLADIAVEATSPAGDLDDARDPSPVVHAAAAFVLLVAAAVLSVYKPRGLTAYGHRRQRAERGGG